jgi:SAM-dependent methyltransferase
MQSVLQAEPRDYAPANGRPAEPSLISTALAVAAAEEFVALLRALERDARRGQRSVPSEPEREAVRVAFWEQLVQTLEGVAADLDGTAEAEVAEAVRAVVGPWLLRAGFWNRSLVKPHGFPGDYRMLEYMYDLELQVPGDPTAPLVVNLLEDLSRSVHSVQAVWHRRRWFRDLIQDRLKRVGRPVRVLDVACGGSRYLRDVFAASGPDAVAATFVDQDPTALAYVASWLPASAADRCRLVCAPVKRLDEVLPVRPHATSETYDVVISTGLFDYLRDGAARSLLAHMTRLAGPTGSVAVCNFAPRDRSRIVKSWLVDWPLIYRSATELQRLFPAGARTRTTNSPDGGLVYAIWPRESR